MSRSIYLLLLAAMLGACDPASESRDGAPPSTASSDSLTDYLHRALDTIEVNSLRIDSIAWGSLREQALESARGAESVEQIHGVITWLLPQLGDDHSFFLPPRAATAWRDQPAAVPTGEEGLSGNLTDGHVAYLSIPGFRTGEKGSALAFFEEAQALIQSLDEAGACGWIVDLRSNGGGNMWPMLAGLGPLLGDGVTGYFVDARGKRVAWGIRHGSAILDEQPQLRVPSPYTLEVPAPPVALLTGPRTASSGEAIARAESLFGWG